MIAELKGTVQHFCHFAAIYDIGASLESQQTANIDGTRSAVELAAALVSANWPGRWQVQYCSG